MAPQHATWLCLLTSFFLLAHSQSTTAAVGGGDNACVPKQQSMRFEPLVEGVVTFFGRVCPNYTAIDEVWLEVTDKDMVTSGVAIIYRVINGGEEVTVLKSRDMKAYPGFIDKLKLGIEGPDGKYGTVWVANDQDPHFQFYLGYAKHDRKIKDGISKPTLLFTAALSFLPRVEVKPVPKP